MNQLALLLLLLSIPVILLFKAGFLIGDLLSLFLSESSVSCFFLSDDDKDKEVILEFCY